MLDYLAWLAEFIMVALTTLMVALVSYQVFQRYVLHYTPPWSEELSVYLMIWFGIIGIAVGVRRNAHMSLHFFADLMPLKVQNVLTYVRYCLILIYCSFLTVEGLKMVELTMSQRSPAMGMPVGFVYLALPVSTVLIILFTLEALGKSIRKKGGQ
ncbi:MAG: TRAP transporter small permease [Negativicutes bacterium]|nr:TRAP transporter small permease [Negativicutes bacterium]